MSLPAVAPRTPCLAARSFLTRLGAALLALAFVQGPAAAAPTAVQDDAKKPALSSGDMRNLTKILGEYFDARRAQESDLEAREELDELIAGFEGKRGEKRNFLSLVPEIEQAMRDSRSYSDRGVSKGKVQLRSIDESFGGKIEFAVLAPAKYNVRTPWPLIVSIPDLGESLDDHLKNHWADPAVREGAILVAVGMPADEPMWNTIGSKENGGGVARVMHTLREVRDSLNVDIERIFLAGKGRGVETAMTIANLFPDRLAGVIGRSGDAADIGPANLMNMGLYFAGAGERATAFQKAAEELGHTAVTVQADADEQAVWKWLNEQKRRAHPTSVTLAPTTREGVKAYWLEMEGINIDDRPTVKAKIDRETNTVTIDAERVSLVRVFFNDVLFDLDKPVKVVLNGVTTETLVQRNLRTMLNVAWFSGDYGRVYTAEMAFDVPGAGS